MANTESRPALFIGSSAEGLTVAKLFHDALAEKLDATLWKGTFGPSVYTLERLEELLDQCPFALFILSPDDVSTVRGKAVVVPRDNVIFELGLFIGRQGRRSVFFAVPDSVELKLPSDIGGLMPVTYSANTVYGQTRYDVSFAVEKILHSISLRRPTVARLPQTRPSPFWDVLSDNIVILYGVEADVGSSKHRVSMRDLETAWELKSFLDARYPSKVVWPVPTTESWWERYIRSGADLVVVGGFVTNTEFAKHRSSYERNLRVKMGRLCIVDGQRVHFSEFVAKKGKPLPRRGDPQETEDYPTNLMSRDFGFVFNGPLKIYGRERRVVAIAGIKGHGTRGAALYVTDDRNGIDAHLEGRSLQDGDALEIAVAVEIATDTVHRIDPIRILLNDQSLRPMAPDYSQDCELGRPREGCDFGVQPVRREVTDPVLPPTIKAIVFDLDDTLFDTYNSLIVPLEMKAAHAMIAAGAKETDPTNLASAILHLRKTNPANLETELLRTGFDQQQLSIREPLLTPSLDDVVLYPDVTKMLRRLRNRYELYLLTSGKEVFQREKVERLQIGKLFADILVVPDSSAASKTDALRALAERFQYRPENVLVVGNRLDNEIAAGNLLSMPTVWIRRGEGSQMTPGTGTAQPTVTLSDVLGMTSLLEM